MSKIQAIDKSTIHHITSGQVVIDLQTAVKELLENCIDAGATSIEVRFKQNGLSGLEIIDNGYGIAPEDHDGIGLKHHTSKLSSYSDLDSVTTLGFRGEALSALCALCGGVTVTTATSSMAPKATCLVLDTSGKVIKRSSVARQQGTTVSLTKLFSSLAVRRKEFERNIKREYGKALTLLTAYALGPCAGGKGIRLTVTNQPDKGQKTFPIKTLGAPSFRSSITALWGPKADENIVDINLSFEVEKERIKRLQSQDMKPIPVEVQGLISEFTVGSGRSGMDRQFLYVNGRPCDMPKVQKAFNEVYRTFNTNQVPFILADFILPTDAYDVNVSPDKRTILLHSEANLIIELKATLEAQFSPSRSTYSLGGTQPIPKPTQTLLMPRKDLAKESSLSSEPAEEVDDEEQSTAAPSRSTTPPEHLHRNSAQEPQSSPSPPPRASGASSTASTNFSLRNQSQVFLSNDISVDSTPSTTSRLAAQQAGSLDSMLVDAVRPATSSDMVIDSSQTAWGRQLGILLPSKIPDHAAGTHPGNPESNTDAETRPSKKRKSNADDLDRPADKPTRTTDFVTKLGSLASGPELSTALSSKGAQSNPGKSRTSLRTLLASFTAPGTQLSSPSIETLRDEEDANQAGEDDEIDQLANDASNLDGRNDDPCSDQSANHASTRASPLIVTPPRTEITQADASSLFLEEEDEDDPNSVLSQAKANGSTSSVVSSKDRLSHPEIVRTERTGADVVVRFDFASVQAHWDRKHRCYNPVEPCLGGEPDARTTAIPAEAGVANVEDGEDAERALSRVIDKQDFETMDVIGQFNLGFIIARRRKESGVGGGRMDDLFIVDQHAADEKYNFETLQTTTEIKSQKLVRPRPLELPAADEMVAMENLDALHQSGFDIEIDTNATTSHSRLKLCALPTSKNTVFDVKDLEEILYLMRNRPTGQIVRCSKARAMFAMRACRKSVMVGMPLKQSQMTTVVRHMGTMDQPWNCPHGRPTMRHLCDLRTSGARRKESVDWSRL